MFHFSRSLKVIGTDGSIGYPWLPKWSITSCRRAAATICPVRLFPRGRWSALRRRADGNVAAVSHDQHVPTPTAAAAWRANTVMSKAARRQTDRRQTASSCGARARQMLHYYVLPLMGGGIKRWCCLTSVCLTSDCLTSVWHLSIAYIGPKSRTERPKKTKIGTEIAHVTRDSDTTFNVKRPKVKVTRPLYSPRR